MKIKVIKFKNYIEPNRAHYNDSGADIFATEDIILQPHSVQAIATGIGLELPDGYDAVIHCKSGLSSKGIWASNSPIDAGYKGETHAILLNTTDSPFKITKGMKIGQIVIRPVIYAEFVDTINNDRNLGAFGSTGN